MQKRITWLFAATASIGLTAGALLMGGCSTTRTAGGGGAAGDKAAVASAAPAQKSGTQMWAQNCGHCHNIRSPGSYSDAQWDVVMLHMRVRANLTAKEQKEILAFLKSAH